MAQTKRKRQTKHRGNAAGSIEARGRTGKKPDEIKKDRRSKSTARSTSAKGTPRPVRPPSWKTAATKAGFMAIVLIILAQSGLFKTKMEIEQTLILGAFAFALYTPLSYWTDTAMYKRRMRRENPGSGTGDRRRG